MKIIVVGASGVIGSAVVAALEPRHDVIKVSRRTPIAVSLDDIGSIDRMFAAVPGISAVVC